MYDTETELEFFFITYLFWNTLVQAQKIRGHISDP